MRKIKILILQAQARGKSLSLIFFKNPGSRLTQLDLNASFPGSQKENTPRKKLNFYESSLNLSDTQLLSTIAKRHKYHNLGSIECCDVKSI